MNLSPEVAALLRQALAKADQMSHAGPAALVAYDHLARTIENLLPPLPQALAASHGLGHHWHLPALRGGGRDECRRCGLVKTNLRNKGTGHFELRYHRIEGLSNIAGNCG